MKGFRKGKVYELMFAKSYVDGSNLTVYYRKGTLVGVKKFDNESFMIMKKYSYETEFTDVHPLIVGEEYFNLQPVKKSKEQETFIL